MQSIKTMGPEETKANHSSPLDSQLGVKPTLVPAPPPPSADAWVVAYEAKRRARAGKGQTTEPIYMNPVTPITRECDTGESKSSLPETAGTCSMGGVRRIAGVIRRDLIPNHNVLKPMSNRQAKKLQEEQNSRHKVEHLIKMAKVDKDKDSDCWAAEYNARKAIAVQRLESGPHEAHVGSLSAFHTGVYGDLKETTLVPAPRVSRSHQQAGESSQVELVPVTMSETAATALMPPNPANELPPLSNTDKCRHPTPAEGAHPLPKSPPVVPMEHKLQTNEQVAPSTEPIAQPSSSQIATLEKDIVPHSNATAPKDPNKHVSEATQKKMEPMTPCRPPPVVPTEMAPKPAKKFTMEGLFKEVREDSKRSIDDWQAEYKARKKARNESQLKQRENVVVRKVTDLKRVSEVKPGSSQNLVSNTLPKTPTSAPCQKVLPVSQLSIPCKSEIQSSFGATALHEAGHARLHSWDRARPGSSSGHRMAHYSSRGFQGVPLGRSTEAWNSRGPSGSSARPAPFSHSHPGNWSRMGGMSRPPSTSYPPRPQLSQPPPPRPSYSSRGQSTYLSGGRGHWAPSRGQTRGGYANQFATALRFPTPPGFQRSPRGNPLLGFNNGISSSPYDKPVPWGAHAKAPTPSISAQYRGSHGPGHNSFGRGYPRSRGSGHMY